jgi:hypothetical protein
MSGAVSQGKLATINQVVAFEKRLTGRSIYPAMNWKWFAELAFFLPATNPLAVVGRGFGYVACCDLRKR